MRSGATPPNLTLVPSVEASNGPTLCCAAGERPFTLSLFTFSSRLYSKEKHALCSQVLKGRFFSSSDILNPHDSLWQCSLLLLTIKRLFLLIIYALILITALWYRCVVYFVCWYTFVCVSARVSVCIFVVAWVQTATLLLLHILGKNLSHLGQKWRFFVEATGLFENF